MGLCRLDRFQKKAWSFYTNPTLSGTSWLRYITTALKKQMWFGQIKERNMHIAILEAGRTNPDMPEEFRNYPDMFGSLFAGQTKNPIFQFSNVPVIDGIFPKSVDDYDGYLVTGSAHGVYDSAPFIATLLEFIRTIFVARKPLVGICFGHQAIAHALGGRAVKFDGGWGIGTTRLKITGSAEWIPSDMEHLDLIHVHQDQVISLPPQAVRLAESDFCKNAAFAIGEQVFSVQGHPEFTPAYTNALINIREDMIGKDRATNARTSLKNPHDGQQVGSWILDFFCGS
jgi:GMP synthase-like glutamine amidotransferase